jgi:hypothetical protein
MAYDQPVKQHPQRRQILLDRRFGMRPLQFFDESNDVKRLHRIEIE